ncbi:MAG: helix-turn-helix domain containing protein, partial [Malacoplasma sp.]|nr:helix-turn-helix domain containing protein [Malacoplasma sp.]
MKMENSEKSKLFDEKILSIARDYKSGKSVNELVESYSVTHKFVRDIIHCRTHKKLLFDNGITPVESRKLGHLDENKVIDICESLMNKETEESLANKYNVSLGAIDAIRRHISWKHITDKYDFDSVELKSAPRIDQIAAERMVKMLDNGMTQRYVAEKFGVTLGTVMKIKKKFENNEKINESRIKNPTRIYNATSNTKPIYQFNEIQ